jgi:hypothetical protein
MAKKDRAKSHQKWWRRMICVLPSEDDIIDVPEMPTMKQLIERQVHQRTDGRHQLVPRPTYVPEAEGWPMFTFPKEQSNSFRIRGQMAAGIKDTTLTGFVQLQELLAYPDDKYVKAHVLLWAERALESPDLGQHQDHREALRQLKLAAIRLPGPRVLPPH